MKKVILNNFKTQWLLSFALLLFAVSPVFSQNSSKKSQKVVKIANKTKKKTDRLRVTRSKSMSVAAFKTFSQTGSACIYSNGLHGTKTATGGRFDKNKLTAAHLRIPLGSRVRVTNLKNGKSVEVTINDRGPYSKKFILDMSPAAAKKLGFGFKQGHTKVKIEPILD